LSAAATSVPEGKVFFDLDIARRVCHVVSRTGVAWLMAKIRPTDNSPSSPRAQWRRTGGESQARIVCRRRRASPRSTGLPLIESGP
jgi:hypothetical protein